MNRRHWTDRLEICTVVQGEPNPETGERSETLSVTWCGFGRLEPIRSSNAGQPRIVGGVQLEPPDFKAYLPPEAIEQTTGIVLRCNGVRYTPDRAAQLIGVAHRRYWLLELSQ